MFPRPMGPPPMSEGRRLRLIANGRRYNKCRCVGGRRQYVYSIIVKHMIIDFKMSSIIVVARQHGGLRDQTFYIERGNHSTLAKTLLQESSINDTPVRVMCYKRSFNSFSVKKIQTGTNNKWVWI